jgi:hypothetical protein
MGELKKDYGYILIPLGQWKLFRNVKIVNICHDPNTGREGVLVMYKADRYNSEPVKGWARFMVPDELAAYSQFVALLKHKGGTLAEGEDG